MGADTKQWQHFGPECSHQTNRNSIILSNHESLIVATSPLHSPSRFWHFRRPSLENFHHLVRALSLHRDHSREVHLAGNSAAIGDTHDSVLNAGVDAGTVFPAKGKVIGSEDVFLPSGNLFVGASCFPFIRHNRGQFQGDQLWLGITDQLAEARIRGDKVHELRIEKVRW